MFFEIKKVDNDYNTVVDTYYLEAHSPEQAEKYCEEATWTGYSYFVNAKLDIQSGPTGNLVNFVSILNKNED